MKAIFVHLSGSKRGKTESFTDSKISVGTGPMCNLNFDQSIDKNTSPFHAEIILQECDYVLKDLDSAEGTFVNNRQIKEVVIHDGDLIEFGNNGPRARFRIKEEVGDVCKPLSEILADSMDIAREPQKGRTLVTATAFFQSLLTEAFTQSSAKFKLVTVFLFLLTFIGIVTLIYNIFSGLTETTKRVELLEFESAIGEKIIKDFSKGVCLIQCSFSLVDEKTGKPLKSWRDGRLLTNQLTGTGFMIGNGKILTNRHIAEPWWRQAAHAIPLEPGFIPKLEVFRAFFPEVKDPVPLKVEKVSDIVDVALVSFDPEGIELPEFDIELSDKEAIEGEPVVLLGYPAGINALCAKSDPEIALEISKMSFLEAAQELSNHGLIKPIATQGHISDVLRKRIIYDAQTTVGGSGGPLFNNKGEVVAVNYGIFRGFSGANFGVPIKYALELIEDEKH
ncbi:trypsin-like serine protease, typically periplasmic [Candidatus Scalindua japonica]|uniref:Trypsin-like serine protease, typically periplasmic n=1 Tax=Candidatus Scalindua japonica TaxID=1284222 RepID=A0A286TY57_9BACT|nr:trypsin-like peptidase domain-containing protein [Candidatus Scalindua japonica]GAX60828.1 trypsin-like serine protease, typically periplasmic [Candidatus Scalindua japonica]